MAKLVTKFKYLKPGSNAAGKYIKYIATREGVERIDDSKKYAPATVKQKQFIEKMLLDFPDAAESLEYEDYIAKPNRINASELISRTMENNIDVIADSKTYADYIATRPRTQKFGSHGLFTDDGVAINLSKVSEELNNHNGNVWTMIVSLHREDAERLGFNRGERWRDMLRTQVEQLSTNLKIPMKNLRWYAAFHNESHHPHIHLIAYSVVENEGYLTKQGIERMRSSLASDIFQQDLISIYEKQAEHRREIKENSKDIMDKIISEINSGTYDNLLLEEKLLLLAEKLSRTSGKKVYGYLKADVKNLIDSIVDLIADDERVSNLYGLWYEQKFNIIRTYTDEMPVKIPLSQNKEFKSVKNMIINQAMNIVLEKDVFDDDDEMIEKEFEQAEEYDNEQFEFTNNSIEDLYKQAQNNNSYAQYKLGKMYLKGEGVNQDAEYGARWLLKAIKQNNNYAQYLLGKAILKGEYLPMDNNLPLDIDSAVELLLKSSDQGNELASYTLGKAFIEGDLLPQDISAGFELLLKASEKNCVLALYYLGKMFYKGIGVIKDIDTAIYYFEKAVKENNTYAAYSLGKIYSSEDEYIDMNKAIYYFRIAANDNNTFAEYQLGKIYLYGYGVEKDYDIAMHYLHLSAKHGNQYAEQLLYSIQKQKNIMAAMGSLRLLQHISNLIRKKNQEQNRRKIGQVDRKMQQKINEKKQAHGLKPSM
jgi:Sel1 repeat protein